MAEESKPVIGIIMGSESDMPAMEPCMKQLEEFGMAYEVKVASAPVSYTHLTLPTTPYV